MKWQKWTGILKLSHKWEHKWEHKWSISFNLSCNSQVTHTLGGVSECLKYLKSYCTIIKIFRESLPANIHTTKLGRIYISL